MGASIAKGDINFWLLDGRRLTQRKNVSVGYESKCPGLRQNFRQTFHALRGTFHSAISVQPCQNLATLGFGNWASLRSWNEKFLSRHEKFAFSFATTWTLTFLPYRTFIPYGNFQEFMERNQQQQTSMDSQKHCYRGQL